MSAAGAARRGQVAAQRIMTDACTITVPGAVTTDPVTHKVTQEQTQFYTGPCRVQVRSTVLGTENAGERRFTVEDVELQLPMTAPEPPKGAVVTMNSSGNPHLVGNVYTVDGVTQKTHATKQAVNLKGAPQ